MSTGNAPCGGCGKHIWDVLIDESTKKSDGNGGFWYHVVTISNCQECGTPLIWLHEPPLESLQIDLSFSNQPPVTQDRWVVSQLFSSSDTQDKY